MRIPNSIRTQPRTPQATSVGAQQPVDLFRSSNIVTTEPCQSTPAFSMPTSDGVREVGEFLKTYLEGFDQAEFKQSMQQHLETLRLVDQNGEFIVDSLKGKGNLIFPKSFTKSDCEAFIDESVQANSSNFYLQKFLERAKEQNNFDQLKAKLQESGQKTIPNVLAYAVVLNGLTKAMVEDYHVIEDLTKEWDKHRKKLNIFKYFDWFEAAKIYSVRFPMNDVIKTHKKGRPLRNFLRWMLSVNILEATLSDRLRGFRGNASAGWTLALNNPKLEKTDTGHYSTSTLDHGSIGLNLPNSKEWAHLYQSWNANFVGKYDDIFPYMLAKLLIPAVANYDAAPKHYIYQRAMALYVHVYFVLFDRVAKVNEGTGDSGWADKALLKLWGEVNKESAQHYTSQLPKKSWFSFFRWPKFLQRAS